ncbi:MAG TPA: GNAT family N-acetyltransferase [Solirubrobacteraceae bacterium]|nr:GNAT family N-acetyltransferase [Solirubrobacteraceae bacterium]
MTDSAALAARRLATQRSFYSLLPGRSFGSVRASLVPESPGRSLFNAVTYVDAPEVAPLVPVLAELYASAGVYAWTVWVLPGDDSLASALAAAGHVLDATPEAMGASLSDLDLSGPDVAAPPTWDQLVRTNAAAYGVPHGELDAMRLAGDGVRLYGAADGAVVLAIHDHDGDAGVTYVAARPEARGRGLVGQLLRQALRDARDRGCTTTTLESTRLGRPVYERIGYRSLGTLGMWERRSAPPA